MRCLKKKKIKYIHPYTPLLMLPLKKNTSSDCFEIQYKIHKIEDCQIANGIERLVYIQSAFENLSSARG